MATAIHIENVSKQYRLGLVGTGTLSHDLNRWWTMNVLRKEDPFLKIGEVNNRSQKGTSDYVWALKDINLEIEQGDVVGIIGKNGAGKSTLLKILSRVTKPSTGSISYKGRIASLLEVGTGFHPEMTGRENIYMNGAIMGMTRAEITRKLDEIIDFSGVERYIDTPTKRYSSGMTVRLGFAIAAHLEPEILVVDEVLAVGDAEFQKKAIRKMQDVSRGEGRTVLFVTHNMGAVRNLCKTGVVLKDGMVDFRGNCEDAIDFYINYKKELGNIAVSEISKRKGNGIIRITNISFESKNGNKKSNFEVGEEMRIIINYNTIERFKETNNSRIDIGINNIFGHRIAWLSSKMFVDKIQPHGQIVFDIPQILLNEGQYNVNLFCETDFGLSDHLVEVGKFDVTMNDFYKTGRKIPDNQGYIIMDYIINEKL